MRLCNLLTKYLIVCKTLNSWLLGSVLNHKSFIIFRNFYDHSVQQGVMGNVILTAEVKV